MVSDLRQALRVLLQARGFSALVIGLLAVGIGATTTIFSVVNGVLLKPLPFAEAARLVAIVNVNRGEEDPNSAFPDVVDWRSQATTLDVIAPFGTTEVTMTGRGEAVSLQAVFTTSDLFRLVGASPLLGRVLTAADDATGAAPVAVISESMWARRFGRSPSAVGEIVMLEGRPTTIVGVMPASFEFPVEPEPIDTWVPLGAVSLAADMQEQRGAHFLDVIGRLAPQATLAQANAELGTIAARLASAYPETNANRSARAYPLQERLVRDSRLALIVLMSAVGAVLLIACSNVANLLLARGAMRHREMAIRAAMGAPRARLARQLLVESVLLSVAAGVVGVIIARWGVAAVLAADPLLEIPRLGGVVVDRGVLLFATLVSVATGILFGLAPALQLSRTDASDALKDATRGSTARGARTRQALVVAEVALSIVLVASALLLGRSLAALQRVDAGFVAERAVTAGVTLPPARYEDPAAWVRFYRRLLDELSAVPGTTASAVATTLPMSGSGIGLGFSVEGRPQRPGERQSADYFAVSPQYFEAMGIRVVQGRTFTARDDENAPNVVIVSETMARRYWPQGDALGKRVTIGYNNTGPREIVGIVADVKTRALSEAPAASMYTPFPQTPWPFLFSVVRTDGDAAAAVSGLRAAIVKLDPEQPVEDTQTLTHYVERTVAAPRLLTGMVGGFAAFALLLAGCGVFSVLAYAVAQRRREFGIRIALGAQPGAVRALVLQQVLRLGAAGLILGLAGALAIGRVIGSLLFGVTASDPVTLAAVGLLLLMVLLVAAYLPVRRATHVDPVAALRAE